MTFEFKKIIKNKFFHIFVLIAIIFTCFINFIKKADINFSLSNGLEDVLIIDSILEKDNDLDFHISDTYPPTMIWNDVGDKFNEDYQKIISEVDTDDLVLASDEYLGENPPIVSFSYIDRIYKFIKKYDLKISKLNKQKLDFLIDYYKNLEKRNINPESFIKNIKDSSQNIFYSNMKTYFGIIPVLLISLFVGASLSKEYDNDQVFLKLTSTKKRIKILLDKLGLGLSLSFLYFVLVFLTSIIIGKIRGEYDWIFSLPIASFGENPDQVLFLGFLLKSLSLFMARVFFFTGFSLLVSLIIKNTNIFLQMMAFLDGILAAFTNFSEKMQTISNPFYFSYYDFLLGSNKIANNSMGGVDFSYQSPSFSLLVVLSFIGIGLIFLLIGQGFIKEDKKIFVQRIEKRTRKEIRGLFSFEKLKIHSFNKNTGLNFTLIAIFLLVFSINLRLKMSSHDFYAYKNTFTKISIVRETAEFEKDNNLGEKAQTYLDKLNLLDKYREDVDSEIFYKIISKASLFSKSLGDDFNLALADEHFKVSERNLVAGQISEFSIQASDTFRRELIKRKIKPMNLLYDRTLTFYDKTKDGEILDMAINAQIPKDTSSFILLFRLIYKYKISIILLLVSVFIYAGAYKYEFINENSYDLIKTQPIDKRKIYDKKFVASLVFCFKFLIIILGAIFLLGLIKDPRNTLNFPILKYIDRVADPNLAIDYSKNFTYISLGKYLLELSILSFSLLVFLVSLTQLLSLICKDMFKTYLSLGFVLLIMFVGLFIGKSYSFLNPISYFLPEKIVDASLYVRYGLRHFDNYFASLYLLLLAFVFYLFGRSLTRKI